MKRLENWDWYWFQYIYILIKYKLIEVKWLFSLYKNKENHHKIYWVWINENLESLLKNDIGCFSSRMILFSYNSDWEESKLKLQLLSLKYLWILLAQFLRLFNIYIYYL